MALFLNNTGLSDNSCLGGGGAAITGSVFGGGSSSRNAPRGSSINTGVRGEFLMFKDDCKIILYFNYKSTAII